MVAAILLTPDTKKMKTPGEGVYQESLGRFCKSGNRD